MALHTQTVYVEQDVSIRPPHPGAIRKLHTSDDVATSVAHWLLAAEEQKDVYYFSVYWGNVLVGQIVLHDIDYHARTSLIAYHLFEPRYRNHGIGTKALELLLRFVVKQTDLTQLVIITSRDNIASQRIAQKCGFVYAGDPREDPAGILFEWNRIGEM